MCFQRIAYAVFNVRLRPFDAMRIECVYFCNGYGRPHIARRERVSVCVCVQCSEQAKRSLVCAAVYDTIQEIEYDCEYEYLVPSACRAVAMYVGHRQSCGR